MIHVKSKKIKYERIKFGPHVPKFPLPFFFNTNWHKSQLFKFSLGDFYFYSPVGRHI